jgi:hypothetical protein
VPNSSTDRRATLQELLLNAVTCQAGRDPGAPAARAAVSATPFRAGDGLRLLLRVRAPSDPAQGRTRRWHCWWTTRATVVVTDSTDASSSPTRPSWRW